MNVTFKLLPVACSRAVDYEHNAVPRARAACHHRGHRSIPSELAVMIASSCSGVSCGPLATWWPSATKLGIFSSANGATFSFRMIACSMKGALEASGLGQNY